ncbi:MAG: thioredoxin family protein [Proteobacteria bacterium]|nr:thioredoxin family protein [Pseudomonadota bacterium]
MALTPSTMLDLGTEAPDFSLPDTEKKTVKLSEVKGKKPFLVMFICNHCPYVKHIGKELSDLMREFQEKGIAVFGINSNDTVTYPDDSPEKMALEKKRLNYSFPYLVDASQETAKAYRAACTPDFFLFDKAGKLVYRGQFDESRPGNQIPVTGKDLRYALEAVISNRSQSAEQRPSIGCNIKWKKGNAPEYFG